MNWPKVLIPEIAERRCVLVLGAGVSASCTNAAGASPRTWNGLLVELNSRLPNGEDRAEVTQMIGKEQYLDAAQIIVDGLPAAELAEFIRDEFQRRYFEPSELVRQLASLDAKIVITTNYDQIYERFCQQGEAATSNAYVVKRQHDGNVLDEIRSSARVILKAHGCVSSPTRIVLSRSQYFEARDSHPDFFRVLDSLFLTSTLLFIGSSLADPDLQLLLENANMAARSDYPHYALVEGGRHAAIKRAIRASYNVELLEYEVGQHQQVVEAVTELNDLVSVFRAAH